MGRPRERASGFGLLPRMEARPRKDGLITYRYHPVGGKPINLGTDRDAACRQVLDMNGQTDATGTLKWVWERYTKHRKFTKLSQGTQDDYAGAWKQVAARFGEMQIAAITAPLIARYVHVEREESPTRARIEKALLSNLFKHGILLGVCERNPATEVDPPETTPSTVLPQADALRRFLAWLDQQTPQRRIIGLAAEYAALAGNRQVEFRPLCWPQVDRDAGVIRVKRAKQRKGARIEVIEVIQITPRLADLLDRIAANNAARPCLYLFPTRDNTQYTARGFKTLWQRCVIDAMKAGVITEAERFNFHALRAYYATAHKQQTGKLPDMHKNKATTETVYDRSREVKRSAL